MTHRLSYDVWFSVFNPPLSTLLRSSIRYPHLSIPPYPVFPPDFPLRQQVDEITEEGGEDGSTKSYKISFMQMAADGGNDLIVDQPEGVNATFSRALMKRASM